MLGPPRVDIDVPEISRFYGISVRMYYNDHPRPHFHARYAGRKAKFEIRSLTMIEGDLPPRVVALVTEWGARHRAELMLNWRLMRAGTEPRRIAPLE